MSLNIFNIIYIVLVNLLLIQNIQTWRYFNITSFTLAHQSTRMNQHRSIDSGLATIDPLYILPAERPSPNRNVNFEYSRPSEDSAIDLRFNPRLSEQLGFYWQLGARDGRHMFVRVTCVLDRISAWFLFIPTVFHLLIVFYQWVLLFSLMAVGLCWWPFLIVAFFGTANMFVAVVFIGLKFPDESFRSSSLVYSGLLIIVNSLALTAYVMSVTLEAPMQCFSTSVKLIFSNSTLNINPKQHFPLIFPLYRELTMYASERTAQSQNWNSTFLSTSSHEFGNEAMYSFLFVFIFLDLVFKSSAMCVLALETAAALPLHWGSRPRFTAAIARCAGGSQSFCNTCFMYICVAPFWWTLALCVELGILHICIFDIKI